MRTEESTDGDRRCDSRPTDVRSAPVLLRKTATAYTVVRVVRLLQARGVMPGHGGVQLGGVHLHHHVWGTLLVLASPHLSGRPACLHRPLRSNVLCTGIALVLDEFDILTGTDGRPVARRMRALVDAASALAAVDGLRHWQSTWSGWHCR